MLNKILLGKNNVCSICGRIIGNERWFEVFDMFDDSKKAVRCHCNCYINTHSIFLRLDTKHNESMSNEIILGV